MKITCCLHCEERHVGCHAKCEAYIKQAEQLAIEREKRNREKDRRALTYNYIRDRRSKRK